MVGPIILCLRKWHIKSYIVQRKSHQLFNNMCNYVTLVYRWKNHVDLSSLIAQLHLKICTLFSSCNPRELPLCVFLPFLPSAKIYGYVHCFCSGSFVPGGCRCLPHTEIKLQDSHTVHMRSQGLWALGKGCT